MGRPKGSKNRRSVFIDPTTSFGDQKASAQASRAANIRADNGRRFPGRKVHPATANMDYTAAELEFIKAMSDYIQVSGKKFPTWSEALAVVFSLGYTKDANLSLVHGRDEIPESEEHGRLGLCAPKSPGRVHRKRMC